MDPRHCQWSDQDHPDVYAGAAPMSKGLQGIAYGPTPLRGLQPAPMRGGFYDLVSGMPASVAFAAAGPQKGSGNPAR